MKKVFQTIIDKNRGNCMQATIASLLDLDINNVPNFIESDNPNGNLIQFILDKGFNYKGCLYNYPESPFSTIDKLSEYNGLDGYFYASVYSPKYYDYSKDMNEYPQVCHAVIIDKNYNIVHDPNINNENLQQYPMYEKLGFNGIKNVYLIEKNEN